MHAECLEILDEVANDERRRASRAAASSLVEAMNHSQVINHRRDWFEVVAEARPTVTQHNGVGSLAGRDRPERRAPDRYRFLSHIAILPPANALLSTKRPRPGERPTSQVNGPDRTTERNHAQALRPHTNACGPRVGECPPPGRSRSASGDEHVFAAVVADRLSIEATE
jgi:hypothetical protein